MLPEPVILVLLVAGVSFLVFLFDSPDESGDKKSDSRIYGSSDAVDPEWREKKKLLDLPDKACNPLVQDGLPCHHPHVRSCFGEFEVEADQLLEFMETKKKHKGDDAEFDKRVINWLRYRDRRPQAMGWSRMSEVSLYFRPFYDYQLLSSAFENGYGKISCDKCDGQQYKNNEVVIRIEKVTLNLESGDQVSEIKSFECPKGHHLGASSDVLIEELSKSYRPSNNG